MAGRFGMSEEIGFDSVLPPDGQEWPPAADAETAPADAALAT